MNKLLLVAFSVIITSTSVSSSSVFADQSGGWPTECSPQAPAPGNVPHGPLTANPVGNSVTLNTVTTGTFPNTVIFVLDPGVGSSTQNAGFIPSSTPIAAQFNGLSPGPHTAVVCYITPVNTGHSDIVNFVISDSVVAGEIIPIETTSLILASAQSFSWMIPVLLSGIGIGIFVVSRKSENS